MGSHCEEPSCKQLDYLPMKCDACSRLFCKDHLLYDDHTCSGKYKKDIQVKCLSANLPTCQPAKEDISLTQLFRCQFVHSVLPQFPLQEVQFLTWQSLLT